MEFGLPYGGSQAFSSLMAKWAFLAPWWRVLQAHELRIIMQRRVLREELRGLSVSANPRTTFVPSHKHTPDAIAQSFATLRDSLELVLLLAIVDRSAFDRVIRANVDGYLHADAQQNTACMLEFHHDENPSYVELRCKHLGNKDPAEVDLGVDALTLFITPQPLCERDPAFQDARRKLLGQILRTETNKILACESLRIVVGIARNIDVEPQRLVRVLDAAADAPNPELLYPFIASDVELRVKQVNFSPIDPWNNRRSRLPCDRIAIHTGDWHSLPHLGQVISMLLQGKSSTANSVHCSVDLMRDHDEFCRVFSALMHTQHIRSLALSLRLHATASVSDRRLRMRWFAYTLLSRWATHKIKHIHVDDIELTDDDWEDLRQFLRRKNPLPLLFGTSDSDEIVNSPARQVLARQHAPVDLDLPPARLQAGGEYESVLLPEETWLDVISEDTRDKGSWLVLVPAYGKCRLGRADTIGERLVDMQASVTGAFVSDTVKSFSVMGTPIGGEKGHGMAAFLRFVGRSLEALGLPYLKNRDGDDLVNILASCPSLKRIDLPLADAGILQLIIKAYDVGACKATVLNLCFTGDWSRNKHYSDFYESLADPSQRICTTVRELIFSYTADVDEIPEQEITAIRKMLESNHTLQYFERRCKPVHNAPFVALCRDFNDARHATTTPLEPRSKFAFLSAVSSDASSMPPLDSVMITLIFAMAAEPVVRRAAVGSAS